MLLRTGDPETAARRLVELVRTVSAAAALSLAGQGGTGRLATADEVRAHLVSSAG